MLVMTTLSLRMRTSTKSRLFNWMRERERYLNICWLKEFNDDMFLNGCACVKVDAFDNLDPIIASYFFTFILCLDLVSVRLFCAKIDLSFIEANE